jgi:hypothetical protein
MSDQTPTPETPVVPPRVRTIVYFVGLAFVFVGILATEISDDLFPAAQAQVEGIVSGIDKALLFLAGTLGVAYRPTR